KTPPSIGGPSMFELYGITGLPTDPSVTGGLNSQNIGGFTSFGRQTSNPQFQNPFVINPRFTYSTLLRHHSFKIGDEYQKVDTEIEDFHPKYGSDTYSGQFSRPANVTASNNLYNVADFLFGGRSQYALHNLTPAKYRQ